MADMKQEGRLDQAKTAFAPPGVPSPTTISSTQGHMEQLVGRIKEKTGESEEEIRTRLGEILQEGE